MDKSIINKLSEKISQIENYDGIKAPVIKFENNNLDDESKKCYRRISLLASYKERCSEELRIRLITKENFSQNAFDNALKKAINADIVNDKRYSEVYVLSKLSCNKGLYGVLKHLEKMKIDFVDNEYLTSLINKEKNLQFNKALNVLNAKKPKSKNLYAGAVNKLLNRGFSMKISVGAAKEWIAKQDMIKAI